MPPDETTPASQNVYEQTCRVSPALPGPFPLQPLAAAVVSVRPNLVWVSDITYLKAGGTWYYLCIIMDLFSRKVIAWQLSRKADAALVYTAFQKAYTKRHPSHGLLFHSDQGIQYTAREFRQLLDSCHIVQSFSKKAIHLITSAVNAFLVSQERRNSSQELPLPI